MVRVNLEKAEVTMEVDTGASISVMSEEKYLAVWKGNGPQTQPVEQKVKICTGEHLKIRGVISVPVA